MAVGEKIVSVFNGAADKTVFEEPKPQSQNIQDQVEYDEHTLELQNIYGNIRETREGKEGNLKRIFVILKEKYPEDWLASLEIYEILVAKSSSEDLKKDVLNYLEEQKSKYPEYSKLIEDGLFVIHSSKK